MDPPIRRTRSNRGLLNYSRLAERTTIVGQGGEVSLSTYNLRQDFLLYGLQTLLSGFKTLTSLDGLGVGKLTQTCVRGDILFPGSSV